MKQVVYKEFNHKAWPFFLPKIPLHLPSNILSPSAYIPRLFRTFQKQWKSRLVSLRHLAPHIVHLHILEQKARSHDLERLRDRMQPLVVPIRVAPANARMPWYTPLEHSIGPHILERAAATLSGDGVNHARGAMGDMHQDSVDDYIDGDLIDVTLPRWIWEAGAEVDAEGGRCNYCSEPQRCGCRTPDLVIRIWVAKSGSDDGRPHDQQLIALSALSED